MPAMDDTVVHAGVSWASIANLVRFAPGMAPQLSCAEAAVMFEVGAMKTGPQAVAAQATTQGAAERIGDHRESGLRAVPRLKS